MRIYMDKATLVKELIQILESGGSSEAPCDPPLPTQDFRKLHVIMKCTAKEGEEFDCSIYRPSATGGCACQSKSEVLNTCLMIGVT